MPDMTLTCRDCEGEFVFTEGEQDFFKQKGFDAPVRCPECRRRRKADKMARQSSGYDHGSRDW